MISRITLCSAPPAIIRSARFGPIPVTWRRRGGPLFDDVEHCLTESVHEFLGVDRPDAADHAGADILLDPLDRRWCRSLQERSSELDAMRAVGNPVPACMDELAGRDHRRATKDGNQVRLARALTRSTQKRFSGL